jgi:hypothetical protein
MASTDGAKTFHKSGNLPKEIRLLIWESVLPNPRVVNIVQKPLELTVRDWERANGATKREDIFVAAGMTNPRGS